MRIHQTLNRTRANGPGVRAAIWTQGCNLACKGCWNPATHPVEGEEVSPEELAERIVREADPLAEGVTISGGEPMQQALSVYRFITMIKAIRPEWSIGMFTGYNHQELTEGRYFLQEQPTFEYKGPLWNHQIKPNLDWAVIGRFDITQPRETIPEHRQDRHFVSSRNQFLDLYTQRYTYADFGKLKAEFTIGENGLTTITGFPL